MFIVMKTFMEYRRETLTNYCPPNLCIGINEINNKHFVGNSLTNEMVGTRFVFGDQF